MIKEYWWRNYRKNSSGDIDFICRKCKKPSNFETLDEEEVKGCPKCGWIGKPNIKFLFKWYDAYFGVYVNVKLKIIYIVPFPMFVFRWHLKR